MKLVYFGNDALASTVDAFLDYGWSIAAFYVSPIEGVQKEIETRAKQLSAPVYSEKPQLAGMQKHVEAGTNMFFAAEYLHKIPVPYNLQYAVNLHTSLLPIGRGACPLPNILEKNTKAAGLTLHKLTKIFDQGDIVLQQKINVCPSDSLNTLTVKLSVAAPQILRRFLGDLEGLYNKALPQSAGEDWPVPPANARMLDWGLTVDRLNRRIKAFGHLGTIIKMDDKYWRVVFAEAIAGQHHGRPGDLIFRTNDLIAVACLDGFVCIPCKALVSI